MESTISETHGERESSEQTEQPWASRKRKRGDRTASSARSLSSLFADPERILRRFYVFAEEPCKSTITTSEPCSPVFKEAQPRP